MRLLPALGVHPEAYAVVGMGALVAGATDAPITGILLVFEMTNDYAIIVPLMVTVVVAHAIARHWERDSLYSGWLRRRGETIEHGADRDVLAGVRVRDAYDAHPRIIDESAPLDVLLAHLGHGDQACFPVVDAEGRSAGVITVAGLGQLAATMGHAGPLVRAADAAEPSEVVGPSDSLLDAVRKMGVRGAAALPVVDRVSGQVVGLITRGHIVTAYESRVAQVGRPAAAAAAAAHGDAPASDPSTATT